MSKPRIPPVRDTALMRRVYRARVLDAARHGERSIPYRQWLKVVALQRYLASTDPGGNIKL